MSAYKFTMTCSVARSRRVDFQRRDAGPVESHAVQIELRAVAGI